MDNRIYRSRETKMLAGVCGGIADMFNIDPTLVRLVAVAIIFFSAFTFLLVYIMCAIIIPLEPSPGYIRNGHKRPSAQTQTETRNAYTAPTPQAAPVVDVEPPVVNPQASKTETETAEENLGSDAQLGSASDESTHISNDDTVINTEADTY